VAEHRPEWYGFDSIHIKRRQRYAAWGGMMALWSGSPPHPATLPMPVPTQWRLRRLAAERRWIFGWERHTAQPAARFPDGSTVALF
jgi:hypothetical protein